VDNWKLQIYSYGIYRIYIIFPLGPFLFSVFINDFDSYSEVYLIQTLCDKSMTLRQVNGFQQPLQVPIPNKTDGHYLT
jgi:hypothetical protein